MAFRGARSVLIAAVVASLVSGYGRQGKHGTWTLSGGDLAGTRSASGSRISSANVSAAFAARDGRLLWHARLRAGVNACPTVVDDTLLVGSGIRRPGEAMPELVAFALPS